jgi:hypothetical protein
MVKKIFLMILSIVFLSVVVSGCVNNDSNVANNSTENNNKETIVSEPTGNISITNPTNGQTVSKLYTIKGKVSTLKSGENLYVLVKAGDYSWWVQEKPTIESDGTWKCEAQFGEAGDSGVEYTLCALVTNKTLTPKEEYGGTLPKFNYKTEIKVKRS